MGSANPVTIQYDRGHGRDALLKPSEASSN